MVKVAELERELEIELEIELKRAERKPLGGSWKKSRTDRCGWRSKGGRSVCVREAKEVGGVASTSCGRTANVSLEGVLYLPCQHVASVSVEGERRRGRGEQAASAVWEAKQSIRPTVRPWALHGLQRRCARPAGPGNTISVPWHR